MSRDERYSEALEAHVLEDFRSEPASVVAAFASTEALKSAYPEVLRALKEECAYRDKGLDWGLAMSVGYLRAKAKDLAAAEKAKAEADAEEELFRPRPPGRKGGKREVDKPEGQGAE